MHWQIHDGAGKGPEQRKDGMREPKITLEIKVHFKVIFLDFSLVDLQLSERSIQGVCFFNNSFIEICHMP